MLKPDQGPGHGGMLANQVPEAAITVLRGLTCCGCDKCLAKAIAAALNAWPGMQTGSDDGGITLSGIYLPLQEPRE